jgi:hypothetical protein
MAITVDANALLLKSRDLGGTSGALIEVDVAGAGWEFTGLTVMKLSEGRLAGAGLDVYEEEPRVHPGLLPLRNVVLLPHLGSAVFELREQMAQVVVDNIQAFLEGKRPPNLHNPEIYA